MGYTEDADCVIVVVNTSVQLNGGGCMVLKLASVSQNGSEVIGTSTV